MNKKEKIEQLKNIVRNIPDFPIKGIQFKDVTPLFKTNDSLKLLTSTMVEEYQNKG